MKNISKLIAVTVSALLLFTGCKSSNNADTNSTETLNPTETQSQSSTTDTGTTKTQIDSIDDMFSNRDISGEYDESSAVKIELNENSITASANTVSVSGSNATIKDEGTYIISGTLSNGTITVDTDKTKKVQIVLDNASITSDTFAGIYVKQADKVFVTIKDGTKNYVSNSGSFVQTDTNNVDAAIFSKDDLTLNGSGTLEVSSPSGHGIVCKDDLVISGGTHIINAQEHALNANDSVSITNSSLDLTSAKDGIHASNDDDTELGNIYIASGSVKITAAGDGASASGQIVIADGTVDVTSGGGVTNASYDTDTSMKGLKAVNAITLSGGTITVNSADDSVHSDTSVEITGGTYSLSSGDDAIHSDQTVSVSGGEINIPISYEGIEGKEINISDGKIDLTSSDDGMNAGGGNDSSGFAGPRGGGDMFASDDSCSLNISGGEILVNASGDGLDSNGKLLISGGTIFVSGPTNNGNGALDSGSQLTITGGVIVAAGTSGMAENFSSNSTQGAILAVVGNQNANSTITLKDSNGNTLVSFTPQKAYNCVNVSTPEITSGSTYTLNAGTYSETITMTSLIYGSGSGMGMGGGFGGGMGGGRRP